MSKTYTPHREKDGIRKGLWDIMGPPAPPFFFLWGGGGGGGGGGGDGGNSDCFHCIDWFL